MIGPVQLVFIGMDSPEVPAGVREQVGRLRDAGTVGILDVLSLCKNRNGTVDIRPVVDPAPDAPHQPGDLICALLRMARAASTISAPPPAGRGYLLCGDPIPDAQDTLPAGVTVLALLLEHRWAMSLRDAVRDADAFPVGDAWLGREVLREVQLLPPEE
jgi:hypothetical protein